MKGRYIIIPAGSKMTGVGSAPSQSHGCQKKKTKPTHVHELVYGVDINTDIEKHIKNCNVS